VIRPLMVAVILVFPAAKADHAVFAGGCFWCVEAAYQDVRGVTDAVSGFTGGTLQNPTYSGNHEGHFEAVKVTFNPETITYQELLNIFWHNIDPFDNDGQFCDKGFSYRSAIFPTTEAQWTQALASREKIAAQFPGQTIYTGIRNEDKFWPVEADHQDYYKKNPIRYRYYRAGCRRDARLEQIWGDQAGSH